LVNLYTGALIICTYYFVTVQTFIARSLPPVANTLGDSGCQSQPGNKNF